MIDQDDCTCEAGWQAPQPLPGGQHKAGRPLLQRDVQRQLQPRRRGLHSCAIVDGACIAQVTQAQVSV